MFEYPRARLALYTRAPVAGRVKTRMHGRLGEQGALALHKALIEHMVHKTTRACLCPVQLWVAADSDEVFPHEYFLTLCKESDIYPQEGADLGARMRHTAQVLLAQADYVLIVGTDCASVDADYLREALCLLEAGENIVIGPAEDGGYVLLGLRITPDALFEGVPWGSERVMEVTRSNLRAAGLGWRELPQRWDVDTPQDLLRLETLIPQIKFIYNK